MINFYSCPSCGVLQATTEDLEELGIIQRLCPACSHVDDTCNLSDFAVNNRQNPGFNDIIVNGG